jgi:hypothetical protein
MASSKSTHASSVSSRPRPSDARILPQQLITFALNKAEHELIKLTVIRRDDEDWSDDDVDPGNAVDVALHRVRQVMQEPPLNHDDFANAWYEIASIVNLAGRAFSRRDSDYFRALEVLRVVFDVYAELVDEAEQEVQHG